MILIGLLVLGLLAFALESDTMLEWTAGAALLALPLSILGGEPGVAATSMVLLLFSIWLMGQRFGDA